jgi:cytochrome c oxidase assembly protein subunit 15
VVLGKAWREMIHRYAAATLGVLIVIIAALAIQYRRQKLVSLRLSLGLLGLVVAQGVLGMLTVTWQLKPVIVTSHLMLGLSTLATLFWLRQSMMTPVAGISVRRLAPLGLLVLIALALQISLGGWTSSNYAATACPDYPQCQASWWPQADYNEAFVLWRGLGRNYEGGVLELPARVAIQMAHRIGAVLLSLTLLIVATVVIRRGDKIKRELSWLLLAALALQLLIGSMMVLRGFPLWLATAHNAGAALLLLAGVAWYRALCR